MQLSQINLWHLGLLIPLLIALISIPASSFLERLHSARSVDYNGVERSYVLYKSESSASQRRQPLIIALHDNGSSARNLVRISQGKLNKLAAESGFNVVYPEGLKKNWVLNKYGAASSDSESSHSDVGFIKMLVESLRDEIAIDDSRIFVVGMGSGGALAYQLACEVSDMFRAVGVVAASIPEQNMQFCEGASGASLVVINGTKNPVIPYDGGESQLMNGTSMNVLSTEETMALWLKKNGCLYHAKEHLLPDEDTRDNTSISKYLYVGCKSDVQVMLYKVQGGGHTWPGGRQYSKQDRVGRTSRDIDASREIWTFFNQY